MEKKQKTNRRPKIIYTKGSRKSATAQVYLSKNGQGEFLINGQKVNDYFPLAKWQKIVFSPLILTNHLKDINLQIKVAGGGKMGQAEACRHGLSRALEKLDLELRKILKAEGFLTRDSRAKERKKPGLKRARRAPQWQKR